MGKVFDGEVTRWIVSWRLRGGDNVEQIAIVTLTEGYTTFNNIPNIIAIKRSLRPEQVEITSMIRTPVTEAGAPLPKGILCCLICGAKFHTVSESMGHQHFEI